MKNFHFELFCMYWVSRPEESSNYEEEMSFENSEKWKTAIQTELQFLKENNTWTEVIRPKIVTL